MNALLLVSVLAITPVDYQATSTPRIAVVHASRIVVTEKDNDKPIKFRKGDLVVFKLPAAIKIPDFDAKILLPLKPRRIVGSILGLRNNAFKAMTSGTITMHLKKSGSIIVK